MNRAIRRLANAFLTVGAVLGAVTLVLVILGPSLGVRPLLFRSGSMTPTIETGDLALARTVPARDLAVGDIVSVSTSGGARVTHRIVDIQLDGARATLTLRGDANEAADAQPYDVTEADRVVFVVPWVGHVIAVASSPLGLVALGMGAAGLLAIVFGGGSHGGPDGGSGRPRGRRRGRRRPLRVAIVAGSATAAAVAIAAPAQATAWTDDVPLTGTSLTSTTVAAPSLSCGTLGVFSVTFNWTAVSGATSYQLTAGGTTSTVSGTTKTITAVISGGTATVKAVRDFGSTTWTSAASNQRTYTVAAVSLCG